MKNLLMALLAILGITLLPTTYAATLQWSYQLGGGNAQPRQIYADGRGEVAVVYLDTTSTGEAYVFTVVWLNENGREVQKKTLSQDIYGAVVIGLDRHQLVYAVIATDGTNTTSARYVEMDRHGHESVAPNLVSFDAINNTGAMHQTDDRGFFGFRFTQVPQQPPVFLDRYRYGD